MRLFLPSLVLALLATAIRAGTADLVTGDVLAEVELIDGDRDTLRLRLPDRTEKILPTTGIVSVLEDRGPDLRAPDPFNLYLLNGDRIRGAVSGAGRELQIEGVRFGLERLTLPLDQVRAVRFGRLVGAPQARYNRAFENELARARDVVLVQRGMRPFPVSARVLDVGANSLTVRVGDQKRELEIDKVFGFVRSGDATEPDRESLRVRIGLAGRARITLSLVRITEEAVEGPAGRVLRWKEVEGNGARVRVRNVRRMEFLGPHLEHLSSLDPIDVQQVPLFGAARPWRRDAMVRGGPIRLRGRIHERGIGVEAHARLEYVLGRRWQSFFARCGIDDAAGVEGDALFRVWGDGRLLKEVRCRRADAPLGLRLPVKDVDRLVLEVVPGDSYVSDFCDWADARVFNGDLVQDSSGEGE